jgi:hypothetical protein
MYDQGIKVRFPAEASFSYLLHSFQTGSGASRGFYLAGPGSKAVKVKVKFTLEQATKARKGSRGIALLLL